MLIPVQPLGTKAPMFLVHGNTGFMPVGTAFARVLGPDQPVYVLNARGFDGTPPHDTVAEMVDEYLGEVLSVTSTGPLVVVGMCAGSLVALDLATELAAKGCEMGPLILMDPPRVPYGKAAVEVTDEIARQLYEYTRSVITNQSKIWFMEQPFDVNDPQQLHNAIVTGMAAITATSKFTPRPFLGTVELILSAEMAPPFFGRDRPWHKILLNPPVIHAMPFGHAEMLQRHRFDVARLVRMSLQWNARRGTAPRPLGQRFDQEQPRARSQQPFSQMAGE
jgi:thioesterase domain-containing protein